jgi:hypothetical protein
VITPEWRDILIEHIDGPAPYETAVPHRGTRVRAMMTAGLLYAPPCTIRLKRTFITDKGRAALAEALADWADAIVRSRSDALLSALKNEAGEVAEAKDLEEVG